MLGLSVAGSIHTVLALTAIAAGAVQFLRLKGDGPHRAIGYAYVYALLVADGAAMLIFQFTGKLNILHFGVLTNLICITIGMWPVLTAPRRKGWRLSHYYWMSWSYVGVLAAAATEIVIRGPFQINSHAQAWVATAAITALITGCGWLLIERNRPEMSVIN